MEAAAEIFASRGFAGTRVRDVVEAAKVNVAAVNYYFGGKDGLYTATLEHLIARRRALAATPPVEDEEPEDALYRHVLAIVRRSVEEHRETALGRIIAHESIEPSPHFDTILDGVIRPEFTALEAIATRLLPAGAEPDEIAAFAMSVLAQGIFYITARGAVERIHPHLLDPEGAPWLARHICAFSLAALRARH